MQASQRILFRTAVAILIFVSLAATGCNDAKTNPVKDIEKKDKEPVDWVDCTIASADNPRWVLFASACRPFGMVSLSPDTVPKGTWNSGYHYDIEKIHGFSHIHAWQLAAIPVLPTTGQVDPTAGSDSYGSKFSHDTETIHPGYHSVILEDYGIGAELTSTNRVGFHRYTFPKSQRSDIIFDLGAELGPTEMADAMARRVGDREIAGYVINAPTKNYGTIRRRPKPCTIYFVAQFNKPFKALYGWVGDKQLGEVDKVSGRNSGAFVRYSTAQNEVVLLKVAISYVSAEQARLNLKSELPHWDFDRVGAESRKVWNDWFNKIQIEGGTDAQRTKFYTDLWHALLGNHIVNDVDGKYIDNTGPKPLVRQIPLDNNGQPKYSHHNSGAGWCSFWDINLVYALAYPKIMSNFCNFMVDMYKNGGLIPRGPSGGDYTFVMISADSTACIVSAYTKGIRDFDVKTAYAGIRKNAFPGGLMSKAGYEYNTCIDGQVEHYIRHGYITDDRFASGYEAVPGPEKEQVYGWHSDGVSMTLHYAYDDWCLAQMAKSLGKEDDYKLFTKRAHNYKNVFDPVTGFMRPKNSDGSWMEPFDPLTDKGFTEADSWHYTWFVPHDIQGLINLMGGRRAFTDKLNYAFEMASADNFVTSEKVAMQSKSSYGYVNYSNQPGIQVGHLFNYSGAPWLTQKWIRLVKEKAHGGTTPYNGYGDDEDSGRMGSLGVLMAIGLFSVRGGAALEPVYEITSPIFDKVTIHLDKRYYPGGKFVIVAKNNSKENMYIQSATLNGRALDKCWFYHSQFAKGGKLELVLGPKPNKNWASKPDDAPPSMTPGR